MLNAYWNIFWYFWTCYIIRKLWSIGMVFDGPKVVCKPGIVIVDIFVFFKKVWTKQSGSIPYEQYNKCDSIVMPTVPNLLPNVDECKHFEIRTNSCWARDEHHKFFIWAQFFLDNNKITIRHVRSQVDNVRVIFASEHAK